MKDLKVGL